MHSLPALRDLFLHMEWADALVWSEVLSSDAARAEPAVLEKLSHIHRVQRYFLKVWRGEELVYEKGEASLDEEFALARAWYGEVAKWLEGLGDAALGRELSMPWADHYAQRAGAERAQPTLLGETMFQVTSHTMHHRAQVSTLLRQAGGTPPLVDYIGWLWLGRPAPRWPG